MCVHPYYSEAVVAADMIDRRLSSNSAIFHLALCLFDCADVPVA